MDTNASLADRRNAAIPMGLSTHLDIYIERAENSELWDVEGRRYIDFAAGIAVNNTGHRHPKIIARVKKQIDRFVHTSFQTTPYADYVDLCERLNAIVPGAFAKKSFLVSTGAEAIENAVKIARAATGRAAFVAFSGAFHGRTLMGMSLTGKAVPYKAGFGPLVPEVFHLPFPSVYHGVTAEAALKALDDLFAFEIDPTRVAAIFIEPVQGEGGFNPAPPDFLRSLRGKADKHGILLVADEIQTGFGRTGRMFAMEHAGISADIVTMAKGLGGGFPIAAVTARADLMDKIPLGGVGGTFSGNPLACAAALAVLDVIAEEHLVERASDIGLRLRSEFDAWAAREEFQCIGDVRNLGAMVAIEFVKDRATRAPWPELVRLLTQTAARNGLVVLSCGVWGNVVRFLTPLTIPIQLLEEGMSIFRASLREVLAELKGCDTKS